MLEKPANLDGAQTAVGTAEDQIYPPIERKPATFDSKVLQRLLDGEHAETRSFVKELVTQPDFQYYDGTDICIYRRKVLDWTRRLAATGIGRIFMHRSVGGEENVPNARLSRRQPRYKTWSSVRVVCRQHPATRDRV